MPFRLIFSLFLAIAIQVTAQDIRFTNLGYEQGLSQITINCTLQDRDGFLWMGTQGGLNYYDGYTIRCYQQEPGNPNSLSDDNIQCLAEDEEGRLLIGTMGGGLNILDRETGRFERISATDSLPLLPDNTIWSVVPDKNGIIWAGTNRGLVRIDRKRQTTETFSPDTTGVGGFIMVLSLLKDQAGDRLWMGTSNGLYQFDTKRDSIRLIGGFERIPQLGRPVWSIRTDPRGTVWMATNSGLIAFDPARSNSDIRIYPLPGPSDQVAWSVLVQEPGPIWLGTNSGILLFNPETIVFQPIRHQENDPRSLANNVVWSLLTDRSGMIWAGTANGLSGYDPLAVKFPLISTNQYPCHPKDVNAILEDSENNLWIGAGGGGLFQINLATNDCENLLEGSKGLSSNHIWALMEDQQGTIWVGTYGGGLCYRKKGSDRFECYRYRPDCPTCLNNDRVFAIQEGPGGMIWVGTRNGGLNRLDPATGTFQSWLNEPGNPNSIPGDVVLSLKADRHGNLWIGTYANGLSCFNPQTGTFTNYRSGSRDGRNIPDNNIWSILFDHKERLWLGTSSGICLFPEPLRNNRVIHFGNREGLPKSVVMGIVEDQQYNLWLSTFDGLVKLRADSLESWLANPTQPAGSLFRRFRTDEGLQSNGFGQGAYCASTNGFLSFGGINGVNRFKAADVTDNPYSPEIRITNLKVYNQEILIDPDIRDDMGSTRIVAREGSYFMSKKIAWVKSLKISSKIRVISFEFSALHFSRPPNNQYAYKLENFDPDWNLIGSKHDATYTNLPPGHYILHIRGSNSDGVWNPESMKLPVEITPLFHQTQLFTALLVLIILGIFSAVVAAILHSHKVRARREKEFVELQLKTIKNQIDPHFTFNVINTVAGMVYKGDPDRTYDYFSRFARLIRTSLENTDRLKVTLREEVEFVRNYLELEKARYGGDFEYSVNIPPEVDPETEVPKMIIQIFAENSMKHGLRHKKDSKRLNINCFRIDDSLVIEIGDNGVGRKAAASLSDHSSGKGLDIIRRLSDLYRRLYGKPVSFRVTDLYNDDMTAAGTQVEVVIPLTPRSI